MPAIGMIEHEKIEDYHSTDAFSNSRLKDFERLPALYQGRYVTKTIPRRAQTRALSVGSALDLLLLEGVAPYNAKIAVQPETYVNEEGEKKKWSGNAKFCKSWNSKIELENKIIISSDDATMVEEMSKAAYADPDIAALMENGRSGVTWRADFGFALGQCRTDWYNPEGCILPSTGKPTGPYFIELKSSASLIADDYMTFEKDFANRGYHKQIALYREIIQQIQQAARPEMSAMVPYLRCFIVVVDKTEIPQAAVYEPTDRFMALSHRAVFRTLERLQNCYDTGIWPGRPTGVQSLNLPSWEEKKLEEMK